ncbi:hypothetical protein L7F22_043430 [Adiantum nelumboides]|nr:hypothetical protein [Adiantum nelumboides]
MMFLMEFEFKVFHKSGKSHCGADYLSRNTEGNEPNSLMDVPIDAELFQITAAAVEELDPEWIEVQEFLQNGKIIEDWSNSRKKGLIIKSLKFTLIGGSLYRLGIDGVLRRCVLISDRMQIITEAHTRSSRGHFSGDITFKKILQARLWRHSVMANFQTYCKTCNICQRMGRPTTIDMTSLTTIQPLEVFMKWKIDFMGPFKKITPRKNKYIVVATCYTSRWVEAKASPNNIAKSTAWFLLEHTICRYECPIELVFDLGTHFINDIIEILIEIFSIKHWKSTPYYPRCNGQAESSIKTIKIILTKIVQKEPNNWDEQLQIALWAYRTTYKKTTGMTPFQMVYGIEAVVALEFAIPSLRMAEQYDTDFNATLKKRLEDLQKLDELRQRALLEQQIVQQRRKYWHDSKIKVREFKQGDLVLLYQYKLGPKKSNLKIA